MKRALTAVMLVLGTAALHAAEPAPGLPDATLDYLRSKRAQAVDRLARVLLSEGKTAEAVALLEPEAKRLSEPRPGEAATLDDLRLVYLLGVAHESAGSPAKRDEAFALARKLTPPDERTHLLLGRAFEDLHREDIAAHEYQCVLGMPPEVSAYDVLALRSLGAIAMTNRRWSEAADFFGRMATRLREAGDTFREQFARAGQDPREKPLDAADYAARVSRGWTRLALGKVEDWAAAAKDCEDAWRIDPEGIDACVLGERLAAACPDPAKRDELAAAWRRRSDYVAATLRGRIATSPRDPNAYNALAWFCAELGRDLPQGLQAAERALTLRPDEGAFIDTLAEIQFRSGDPAAAVKTIRRVTDLCPWANDYYRRQLDRFESAAKKDGAP